MRYQRSKLEGVAVGHRMGWLLALVVLAACGRKVTVNESTTDGASPPPAGDASNTNASDGNGTGLIEGIDQSKTDAAPPVVTSDAATPASDVVPAADTTAVTDTVPGKTDTGGGTLTDASPVKSDVAPLKDASGTDTTVLPPPDTAPGRDTAVVTDVLVAKDVLAPTDVFVPTDTGSAALITGIQILVDGLSAIHVPAVGSERVSLLQYTSTGTAMAIHVTWDKVVGRWYESSGATHIYLAASGTHHVGLLYLSGSYPIQENGGTSELSGTPSTYKEFVAANDAGYAWIDYGQVSGGGGGGPGAGGGGGTPTALGTVMYQTWQGARTPLTDNLRYRSRVDISSTHAAYVEYASTTTGTPGQIVVQPLSGGGAQVVAASANHQDRPAIDGSWVVWEEYLNSTDAVIRAKNLTTGEVRNLSASTGFRTNPDVRGTRVVWEDQRSGNGDIYTYDLAAGKGEQIAVSGTGHSSGARLSADGLVWIETNGTNMGLLWARWAQ